MILATDTFYYEDYAYCVAFAFQWDDVHPVSVYSERIEQVLAYKSGSFYQRELPCIVKVFEKIDLLQIDTIIIDGYIYTNNAKSNGLGGQLYKHLQGKIPIVGVAKNRLLGAESTYAEVFRGKSNKPLFVSSIGVELDWAINKIKTMPGLHRIPTILKSLDSESRSTKSM